MLGSLYPLGANCFNLLLCESKYIQICLIKAFRFNKECLMPEAGARLKSQSLHGSCESAFFSFACIIR
ncbi:MAG: hypothetical protein K0R57_3491 [Paenibacillaceae bacterium]|jgi:hypothetical protein|nr:hypothetical protein [Paenibacillaceae bacterium]